MTSDARRQDKKFSILAFVNPCYCETLEFVKFSNSIVFSWLYIYK